MGMGAPTCISSRFLRSLLPPGPFSSPPQAALDHRSAELGATGQALSQTRDINVPTRGYSQEGSVSHLARTPGIFVQILDMK